MAADRLRRLWQRNEWIAKLAAPNWCASALLGLSLILYGISFWLPTFQIVTEGHVSESCGYEAFCWGLVSLFVSPYVGGARLFTTWLANVFYFTGLWFAARRRVKHALISHCLASCLSASMLFFAWENISLVLIGYYTWLLSMILAVGGVLILRGRLKSGLGAVSARDCHRGHERTEAVLQ